MAPFVRQYEAIIFVLIVVTELEFFLFLFAIVMELCQMKELVAKLHLHKSMDRRLFVNRFRKARQNVCPDCYL